MRWGLSIMMIVVGFNAMLRSLQLINNLLGNRPLDMILSLELTFVNYFTLSIALIFILASIGKNEDAKKTVKIDIDNGTMFLRKHSTKE